MLNSEPFGGKIRNDRSARNLYIKKFYIDSKDDILLGNVETVLMQKNIQIYSSLNKYYLFIIKYIIISLYVLKTNNIISNLSNLHITYITYNLHT